jgi:5-methylcytosine-specific restriction endonuclease McrA
MQRVFVLDHNRQPLMPCHPARARALLKMGKAAVFRRYPFTIILNERIGGDTQPTVLKIDPGSRITGMALMADFKRGKQVIWAAELSHRGQRIADALLKRRQLRSNRRNRKTRYRPWRPLLGNRYNDVRRSGKIHWRHRVNEGLLSPSIRSRIENIQTWVNRLCRFAPIASLSQELVRFDTHLMQNGNLQGVEYQQGELFGYEVREYLLEKWGRHCAYCGVKHVPLEVEHIVPRTRGGSNRINNLTLACNDCNQDKGNRTAAEYGYPHIQTHARQPLKDAAAINASRWALYEQLKATGLAVEVGSGGRTKYNRIRQNYEKTHWIDAACVGESGEHIRIDFDHKPLLIRAMGRGTRQMCQTDKYGFPIRHRTGIKRSHGFQTGDIVKAIIPTGKYVGRHIGRVTIRMKPSFTINGSIGAHAKYCQLLQRADGYLYE